MLRTCSGTVPLAQAMDSCSAAPKPTANATATIADDEHAVDPPERDAEEPPSAAFPGDDSGAFFGLLFVIAHAVVGGGGGGQNTFSTLTPRRGERDRVHMGSIFVERRERESKSANL